MHCCHCASHAGAIFHFFPCQLIFSSCDCHARCVCVCVCVCVSVCVSVSVCVCVCVCVCECEAANYSFQTWRNQGSWGSPSQPVLPRVFPVLLVQGLR